LSKLRGHSSCKGFGWNSRAQTTPATKLSKRT
jgi:hypothetical protein